MTDRLFNALAMRSGSLDAAQGQPCWGVVTSVASGKTITARVTLQPDGVLSGWLPVLQQSAGNGWGFLSVPMVGQQVMVMPDNGDHEHGVIIGSTWSSVDNTPLLPTAPGQTPGNLMPGEHALVHASGSFLRFNADGSAFLVTTGNLNAAVTGAAMVTTTTDATVAAEGNATVSANGNATVSAAGMVALLAPAIKLGAALTDTLRGLCTSVFANWAAGHVHSNGNGGGNTGAPTTTAPAAGVTSIVNAE